MSSSWLQLTNKVLQDVNETEVASLSSTRGIQSVAKRAVQKAISWYLQQERKWSFILNQQTQDLTQGVGIYTLPTGYIDIMWDTFVLIPKNFITNGTFASNISSWTDISSGTGSVSHTSDGNGRARFNGGASGVGALTQGLSTVIGKTVRVSGRVVGGTLTCYVGTTSGGSEVSSTDITISYGGDGEYFDISFVPSATTTYLTFRNSANSNVDLDYVEVREDEQPVTLDWIEYEDLVNQVPHGLHWLGKDDLGKPRWVTKSNNNEFIVYPAPDRSIYQVKFDAYISETALSVDGSTSSIPTRYDEAIVCAAKIPIAQLRSDPELVQQLEKERKSWLAMMKMEFTNKERRLWAR